MPYEILNKKFRSAQKAIDREVSYVVNATNELTTTLNKQPVKAKEVAGMLDGVVQKIQALKRKVSDIKTSFMKLFALHGGNAFIK